MSNGQLAVQLDNTFYSVPSSVSMSGGGLAMNINGFAGASFKGSTVMWGNATSGSSTTTFSVWNIWETFWATNYYQFNSVATSIFRLIADTTLSMFEIEDVVLSRKERERGEGKVFDNADELIQWLKSE